jgi:2-furoyl-CoA dehydrogenase large subunit
VRGIEPAPPAGSAAGKIEKRGGDRRLRGEGEAAVGAPAQRVWDMLLDPGTLQAVIPGCHNVEKISDTHFRADVTLGIGPVKGRYRADVRLSDLEPPHAVTLGGAAEGALGFGSGEGRITLAPIENGGTKIRYVYEAAIGGKVASIGGRLLDGAARVIIGQFFAALARQAGAGTSDQSPPSFLAKVRRLFGGQR